jgi:hypothetical protein
MKVRVKKLSEVTSNGNIILSLETVDKIETPFGKKSTNYLFAINSEDCTAKVDDEYDLDDNRYYIATTDGSVAKWLQFKG